LLLTIFDKHLYLDLYSDNWYVHLERSEAVALLKELIALNLALPFLVDLKPNKQGKFDLIFKGDCDFQALRQFIAEKKLMIVENKERGYFINLKL
jgi:hypothetical protein